MDLSDLTRLAELLKLTGETLALFSSDASPANGKSHRIGELSRAIEVVAQELMAITEGQADGYAVSPYCDAAHPPQRVGHVISDLDGHLLGVDRHYCDTLGYSAERLLQADIKSITYEPDRDRNADLLDRLVETGEPFTCRKRYLRCDNTLVWLEKEVFRLTGADGRHRLLANSRPLLRQAG